MPEIEQAGFGGGLGICWVAGSVAVLCVICFFFGFGGGWWQTVKRSLTPGAEGVGNICVGILF